MRIIQPVSSIETHYPAPPYWASLTVFTDETGVGEDAEVTCSPLGMPIRHTSHGRHCSDSAASPFQLNDRFHDLHGVIFFLATKKEGQTLNHATVSNVGLVLLSYIPN